jgi:FAD/FMN-containing dehydrogenase
MLLSGWGNYPVIDTVLKEPGNVRKSISQLESLSSLIPRGKGRAYGDSALNESATISTLRLNSMISFDSDTGVLTAESGVTIDDILTTFTPCGWFPPVTPGTRFVTLGGAVASDVHGKNHHIAGSFGNHVIGFDIWTSSWGLVSCSNAQNNDLFRSTIGGHGLTGFITKVTVKLIKIPSLYIDQTIIKAKNLEEIMRVFESEKNYPYSVAWIDCQSKGCKLGRSLFMGGDFAAGDLLGKLDSNPYRYKKPLKLLVPINIPEFALNSFTIKAFNYLYYHINFKNIKQSLVSYDKFFYPLDSILNWNKIYGKRGFLQYQFVLPMESSKEGLTKILNKITNIGTGSFLAVLKMFGEQEKYEGNISFPEKGYTLALDFPIHKDLFPKLDELDKIVIDYGGKLYLTKDSRTSHDIFFKCYMNHINAFIKIKNKWDERHVFNSLQSKRLNIFE